MSSYNIHMQICTSTRILFSHKKEWNLVICITQTELEDVTLSETSQAGIKDILHVPTHMEGKTSDPRTEEWSLEDTKGRGGRGRIKETRIQLRKKKKSVQWSHHTTINHIFYTESEEEFQASKHRHDKCLRRWKS